jgi:hypothetical protein
MFSGYQLNEYLTIGLIEKEAPVRGMKLGWGVKNDSYEATAGRPAH